MPDKSKNNYTDLNDLKVPRMEVSYNLSKKKLFELWRKYSESIADCYDEWKKKSQQKEQLQRDMNSLRRKENDAKDRLKEVMDRIRK